MKKGLIVIAIIVILAIAWYLIFPLFNVIEVQEDIPINDAMDAMSAEEKAEFNEAVDAMKDQIIEMSDVMPVASVIAQGAFKPRAHEVEGKALFIEVDGKQILRFEDFETINGPRLHIYLSSDVGDDDFIDLGKIKATRGNVNYELPENIDLEKYNKVLVWCVPFRVLFSYASLE